MAQADYGASEGLQPQEAKGHPNSYQKEEVDLNGGGKARVSKKGPTNEYVLNVAFFTFIGFMLLQTGFAIIANSQSMLADSEAMCVDGVTYLFNLCAERIKNRPYSEAELQLDPDLRDFRRELRRLYLELVPPTISVCALIAVTILTLRESFETLLGDDNDGDDDDVSASIMLWFSGLNLLLDVVNVTCFARAHQAFGFQTVSMEHRAVPPTVSIRCGNTEELLGPDNEIHYGHPHTNGEDETEDLDDNAINLNMCSAWTHVAADTMRSTAVLVAAGIALIFKGVESATADSVAAVIVSIIILGSLFPLVRGLAITARDIYILSTDPDRPQALK